MSSATILITADSDFFHFLEDFCQFICLLHRLGSSVFQLPAHFQYRRHDHADNKIIGYKTPESIASGFSEITDFRSLRRMSPVEICGIPAQQRVSLTVPFLHTGGTEKDNVLHFILIPRLSTANPSRPKNLSGDVSGGNDLRFMDKVNRPQSSEVPPIVEDRLRCHSRKFAS